MKKTISILVVGLLVSLPVFAATTAGLTPKSPFYFLDTLFERINLTLTFNPEKKANKALLFAEERLAEASTNTEEEKPEVIEALMAGYQANVSLAAEKSKEVKDEKKAEELFNKIADNTAKHQEVLTEVLNKVPEVAKKAIEKALEASKKSQEEALKQVAELRQEVIELKQEIAELKKQQKIEPAPPTNIQNQSGIQELKKEIEKLKKQAAKKEEREKVKKEAGEERAETLATPVVSATRTKTILKQRDDTRFELMILSPTGIKNFSLQPTVGFPYSGELSSCPKEYKTIAVFDLAGFPLKAVITDCKDNVDKFDIPSEGEYGVAASVSPISVIDELNTWIAAQEARVKEQQDIIQKQQAEQDASNATSTAAAAAKSAANNALTTEYSLKINALQAKVIEANVLAGEERAKEILRIYGNTNGREYPDFVKTTHQKEVVDFIYKRLDTADRTSNNVVNFFREKESLLNTQMAQLRNELERKHIELQSEGLNKDYNLKINTIRAQLIEIDAIQGYYDWYKEILRLYGNNLQGGARLYPNFADTDFKRKLVDYIYNKNPRTSDDVVVFLREQASALNTQMAQLSNEQQRRSLLLETQQIETQQKSKPEFIIDQAKQKIKKIEEEKISGLTNICVKHYGEGSSYNELIKDCQCKGGYLFDKGMCVDQKAKEERLESERKIQDFLNKRDALCKERLGPYSKIDFYNTNKCNCEDGKSYSIDQVGVSCKQ